MKSIFKNNKKKFKSTTSGFTLIELLAVIIILAVIVLIATPIILNVVENTKIKGFINSGYGVIEASRFKYLEGKINNNEKKVATIFESAQQIGETLNIKGGISYSGVMLTNEAGESYLLLYNEELNICITKGYQENEIQTNKSSKENCNANTEIDEILKTILQEYVDVLENEKNGNIAFDILNYGFQQSVPIEKLQKINKLPKSGQLKVFSSRISGAFYFDNLKKCIYKKSKSNEIVIANNSTTEADCNLAVLDPIPVPKLGDYVNYTAAGYEYTEDGKGWIIASLEPTIKLISAGSVKTVTMTGSLAICNNYQQTLRTSVSEYANYTFASTVDLPDATGTNYVSQFPSNDNTTMWINTISQKWELIGGNNYVSYMVKTISSIGAISDTRLAYIKCWYGTGCPNSDSRNLLSSPTYAYGIRPIVTLNSKVSIGESDENGVWQLVINEQ